MRIIVAGPLGERADVRPGDLLIRIVGQEIDGLQDDPEYSIRMLGEQVLPVLQ